MDNITYTIEESDGKFISTVKVFDTVIKFLINCKDYEVADNMSKAYIKTVKVIENTCKGMQGYFFVNDFDGEVMHFSNTLKNKSYDTRNN